MSYFHTNDWRVNLRRQSIRAVVLLGLLFALTMCAGVFSLVAPNCGVC